MYYNTGEAEIDCNMLRSTTCDTSIATFCLVYNHRPDENTLGIQRNAIPLLTFVYITLCPMQNLGSDQKRNILYFLIGYTVGFTEKYTKNSSVLLLRLVYFSL